MVIARCLGPEQFYLERVIFPFELLSFQCPPGSELEIWTHGLGGPELLERIPTGALALEESLKGLQPLGGGGPAGSRLDADQPKEQAWRQAG